MKARWMILAIALGTACGSDQQGGGTDLGSGGGGTDPGSGGGDTPGTQSQFAPLYQSYFQACRSCHVPGAWGAYKGIETALDFSTEDTAYATMTRGVATGLDGNDEACNGVRLIGSTYETSLVAAVLDENVRAAFSDPAHPGCDGDTISDMTVKIGSAPSGAFLTALKDWIDAGAPR